MQETKEEIGTSSNSWMQKGEVRNKQDEIIFKHNIINNYANAMADLSVNDLNIHYIGHTKFIPEIPYELLHLSVISTTRSVLLIYIIYIYIYIPYTVFQLNTSRTFELYVL